MNDFCLGAIVGILLVVFASLAVSGLLFRYAQRTAEPGTSIVIDGNCQDGEPEQ